MLSLLEDSYGLLMGFSTLFLGGKLLSTAILFVLTMACSFCPWLIRARARNSKGIMSYLNCLAGGIVLGALLMHMIPEIVDNHGHGHEHGHGHHSHGHGHAYSGLEGLSPLQEATFKHSGGAKGTEPSSKPHHHDHHHHHSFAFGPFCTGVSFLFLLAVDRLFLHSHGTPRGGAGAANRTKNLMEERSLSSPAPCGIHKHHHHGGPFDPECGNKLSPTIEQQDDNPEADRASCHSEDLMGGCHMDGLGTGTSKAQALAFVFALSLHSFLEGLGMASKNTQESLTLYLISLFSHKWLEAFALGVNIMNASFSQGYSIVLVLFYAALTPLGILCGFIFEQLTLDGPYANYTILCLNGLSVGSFLFVSCIEMIPPEFHRKTPHTLWKFIVLCLGFLFMAAISILHTH